MVPVAVLPLSGRASISCTIGNGAAYLKAATGCDGGALQRCVTFFNMVCSWPCPPRPFCLSHVALRCMNCCYLQALRCSKQRRLCPASRKLALPGRQEAGAAFVTLHARTKVQTYDGRADWALIGRAVQLLRIPVSGSCIWYFKLVFSDPNLSC
jgi:hypothetical protein